MGGSLHQRVRALPGHVDHREPEAELLDKQYGPSHLVSISKGSVFEECAGGFAYAVQWHPEWRFAENPFYSAIFKAFGNACRARQLSRFAQFC